MSAARSCGMVLLLAVRCLTAATGSGEISGTVLDWSGGCAPLASLTLVHQGTGSQREIVADAAGKYHASGLRAGLYTIVVQLSGTQISARVEEGQKIELNIVVARTGAAVDSALFRDLPFRQRDYLDAVRAAPNVTGGQQAGSIEGFGPYSTRGNSSLNSDGQRGQDNNFLLDGIDNNEPWSRGAVLLPSAESIREVNLHATYLGPEFGNAAGAVVDVRTHPGQRQFHGSAYEYFENSALNAADFFDRGETPRLAQNQFGGSVGGHIAKSSWFFFADADILRETSGLTVISTVPSAAEKAGDFGSVPIYDPLSLTQTSPGVFTRAPLAGNRIPLSRIPAAAQNLIALYPDPNLPGVLNNYLFTPALTNSSERFNIRTDRAFSARSALFARASYGQFLGNSPGALPNNDGSDPTQNADAMRSNLTTWGGAIGHTVAIRPDLVNELRAGTTIFDLVANPLDLGLSASASLGIPGLSHQGLPGVLTSGFAQLGAAGPTPLTIRSTSVQVSDTLGWNSGRHHWKFGLQAIRRFADGTASQFTGRGTFTFTPDYTDQPGVNNTGSALASLLFGYPAEIRRDVQFHAYHLRGWEWSGFAGDEIQLTRKLTIQAGIRYSLLPAITEADNRLVNFNFDHVNPALDQSAALPTNWRAIAPRVGFAYDIFGNGSTLLRGGFSTAYDTGAYLWEGSLARNQPYASRQDYFSGSLFLGPNLTAGLPAPQPIALTDRETLNRVGGAIYAIEPKAYTPYADLYGIWIEQRLRPTVTLEIGGTGSMGIHLYTLKDVNQVPFPGPWQPSSRRVYWSAQDLSRIESLDYAGGSTYYAGHVRLHGRLAPRLPILMSYTFGKSIDDATAPLNDQQSRPAGPQNFSDPGGARSPSPFDVTQRLAITALYEFPFKNTLLSHWRAASVITAQTGLPFTPQLAVNGLNNGDFQLPNRVGGGSLPAGQQSYLHWFDTGAFQTPPLYQYGNSGYDILRGPGLATLDASLARTFKLTESLGIEARAEAFNLLNRANFALPNRILGLNSSGTINHTITPARQMQLVIRAEW